MRLFCKGRVVERDQSEFNDLLTRMGPEKRVEGARAIILLDIWKVCSVPSHDTGKLLMACYKLFFVGSNIMWIWRSSSRDDAIYNGRKSYSDNE